MKQRFTSTVKALGTANIAGHEDIFLPERELRLVFNGDRVKVRQTSVDRKGKAWGFITEVSPASCQTNHW